MCDAIWHQLKYSGCFRRQWISFIVFLRKKNFSFHSLSLPLVYFSTYKSDNFLACWRESFINFYIHFHSYSFLTLKFLFFLYIFRMNIFHFLRISVHSLVYHEWPWTCWIWICVHQKGIFFCTIQNYLFPEEFSHNE